MRKFIFVSVSLFLCIASIQSCKQKASKDVNGNDSLGLTEITFESKTFDFGSIQEGEVVVHTFNFTNTGDNDLKISEVQPSCGCTTPEYTLDIVKPGDKGTIQVKFDSKGRVGNNTKRVTVYANTSPDATILQFTAEVEKSK